LRVLDRVPARFGRNAGGTARVKFTPVPVWTGVFRFIGANQMAFDLKQKLINIPRVLVNTKTQEVAFGEVIRFSSSYIAG
jgi:hypothetical protein